MKTLTLASLAFIIGSTAAMAGTPLVDYREQNQAHRIYNGVKSGEIKFPEFVKLLRGQAQIYRTEHRFKADGVVTPAERAQLYWMQTRQDFRIYNKKHN